MKKVIALIVALLLVSQVTYGDACGWTDDGTVVRLATSTDKVSIGTTSTIEQLTTTSNAIIGYSTYPVIYLRDKYWWSGLLSRNETPWNDKDSYVINIHQENQDNRPFVIQSKTTQGKGAGTPLLLIESYTGNVGIGTANPGKKLDVIGDISIPINNKVFFGGAYIQGYYDNYYDGLKFYSSGVGPCITIKGSGDVGIGTTTPQSKLAVNGTITAKEVVVTLDGWPDFVFADNYKLMPLNKLERYIKTNRSLPGIPKEKEVVQEGVNLGEMQAKLLQKVEELTLYVIELKKENEELERTNKGLEKRISALEK